MMTEVTNPKHTTTTMILPIEVRQAAGKYANGNIPLAEAFIQGWIFANPSYKGIAEAPVAVITMESVITKWLEYKKEKRQSYKPRGLASFKKKIMEMSGGDPVVADAIVEQSMANNYQGIFPLKYKTTYARQSDIIGKVADILAD